MGKAQALRDSSQSQYMMSKKTMEINPTNSIISALREKADADQSDKTVKDLIWLMYDTSLLTSGFRSTNPLRLLLVFTVLSNWDYQSTMTMMMPEVMPIWMTFHHSMTTTRAKESRLWNRSIRLK